MEWIDRLNRAVEYLEECLEDPKLEGLFLIFFWQRTAEILLAVKP